MSFCRGQMIYFNPARPLADNVKFYYMFIYKTVLEVSFLFHAESARNYLF